MAPSGRSGYGQRDATTTDNQVPVTWSRHARHLHEALTWRASAHPPGTGYGQFGAFDDIPQNGHPSFASGSSPGRCSV